MNMKFFLGAAVAIALAAPTVAHLAIIHPAIADDAGETVTPQFNQAIPNIPGKSLIAVTVDYAPGAASPAHLHAKSAFIFAYVVAGAIESQVDDGPVEIFKAGESFHEQPGATHRVSRNASTTEPAKLLAVFVVDSGDKALTTPLH
ncbi:MAG: cupin domain-containing protein [Proteobacteria bacterium]|nr:cupin domain-containing protein [Pseudomonadota bacterium]